MGVSETVISIMKALREGNGGEHSGLTGRYETAYGITEPVEIRKGLGQGDFLSPVSGKGYVIPNICGRRHYTDRLCTCPTTGYGGHVGNDKDPWTEHAD
eukprot:2588258-Pleurochrysis_carterae.AAC.1